MVGSLRRSGTVEREAGLFRGRVRVCLALGVCLVSLPAAAQDPLSGAAGQSASGLSVSATVAAGYDDDQVTGSPGVGTTASGSGATRSHLNGLAGFTYSQSGRRLNFGASGGSSFRLDRAFGNSLVWSHNASAGFDWTLARRLTLHGSASASYSPLHQFSVFPTLGQSTLGQVAPPTLGYGLSVNDVFAYQSAVALTYASTARSSVAARYNAGYVDFEGSAFDLRNQSVGLLYRRGVSRNLTLRLGYTYQQGQYPAVLSGTSELLGAHNIDAGLDYSRALSFSRRTTVSFGTGSAAVSDGVRTSYRLLGHATLTHQLFRTWTLDVTYDRGLRFIDGFSAPSFSDSVSIGTRGQLARRLQLVTSAGYSSGGIGLASTDSNYSAYFGSVRLVSPLTSRVGAFGEYVFYYHDFSSSVALPQGSPGGLSRQGVRVGLSLMLPLSGRR